MFNFNTVIGEFPVLLLGIPLTLGITAVAFVVGTVVALPIALARISRLPGVERAGAGLGRVLPHHPAADAYRLGLLRPSGASPTCALMPFTVVAGALACSTSAQMGEIFRGGNSRCPEGSMGR